MLDKQNLHVSTCCEMNTNKKDIRKRIEQWKAAGAIMEKQRRDRILNANCRQAIEALDDAFESALLHTPPRRMSGLVEQQAWFSKLNR